MPNLLKTNHLGLIKRWFDPFRITQVIVFSVFESQAVSNAYRVCISIEVHDLEICDTKSLTCCVPNYLADMLHPYIPTTTLRSCASNLLVTPPARTVSYGEGRFPNVAPATWNSLPQKLRDTSLTLAEFKSLLKTHLFHDFALHCKIIN